MEDAAELAEGRADDDLLAVGEALADDLQAGEELWCPLSPRAARAFSCGEGFGEGGGAGAQGSEAQVGDLHADLVAAVRYGRAFFLAAQWRVFDVVFVDGELRGSGFDDDGFHCFLCYFDAAVCFSTADYYWCKGFPEAVNRADTVRPFGCVSGFLPAFLGLYFAGYVAFLFEKRIGETLTLRVFWCIGPAPVVACRPRREPEDAFEAVLDRRAGEHEAAAGVEQAHAGSDTALGALQACALVHHHAIERIVRGDDAGHGGSPHAGYAIAGLAHPVALVAHAVLLAPRFAVLEQVFARAGLALVAELRCPLVAAIEAEGLVARDVELRWPSAARLRVESLGVELLHIAERAQRHIEELRRRDRELVVQRAGGYDERAARFFDKRPRDRGKALAHAWLPGDDRAVLQGGAGEVFDLEGFEFH